jgi:uncharacterized protein (TIGR03437 family)
VFRVSPDGISTVFAGNGRVGFSGDGGLATAATLTEPGAVAVDPADNVYVSDYHNERVRKIDHNGIITTIAGGGTSDHTDEIPALSGTLFEPVGLAFDAAGNLYIAESGVSQIRKVTPDGFIHHVAGSTSGLSGFSGDGGPAANALLNGPQEIAVDPKGNLYIADLNNQRIRKIDPNGVISTVAGSGSAGFGGDGGLAASASLFYPSGVAVDTSGNLFIADQFNRCVRRVTPSGMIDTVAGNNKIFPPTFSGDGGPATVASLGRTYGIAVDPAGNVYISDEDQRRIRRVDVSGNIDTVAGNGVTNFAGDSGTATQAALDFPTDVKVDSSGNLYIADSMNHRVRKVASDGTITTIAGLGTPGFSGDGGLAVSAQLNTPVAVAIDSTGNVYISEQGSNRIRRVAPSGVISTFAGNGQAGYSGDGGLAVNASLWVPGGLATDPSGNLFVADTVNNRIRKITSAGTITTVAGNGSPGFSGDGGPATKAMLSGPEDVASDQAGNLYIADGRRLRRVAADGNIATVASSGGPSGSNIEGVSATQNPIDYIWSVAVDTKGNIYICGGQYLYRINAAGLITLLVGGGLLGYQEGFDGDGGPAVAAHLVHDAAPVSPSMGLAADSAGNLFFADTGNDRIRKITNANAAAQLAVSNPDFPTPSAPYDPTGGDQRDWNIPAGTTQRLVVANVGTGPMEWTATTSTLGGGDWLRISSSSGSAPATVTVGVDATNLSPGLYLGTVLFSAPSASNSPRYVSGALVVPLPFVPAGGSSGTLWVTEPPGAGWSVNSSVDWITITGSANGTGNGSVSYIVAANPNPAQRNGALEVGGESFPVNQGFSTSPPVAINSIRVAGGGSTGAQNAWIEIRGKNLVPGNTPSSGVTWSTAPEFTSGRMPTQLGGFPVTVTVNNKPAFIYFLCSAATSSTCTSDQINVLTPLDSTVGPVPVVVTNGGNSSTPFIMDMRGAAPSFPLVGTSEYVVATHADNSLVGPASLSSPGYPFTPAEPGETIVLYGFGFGLPATALVNGSSQQSGTLPALPSVQIAGTAAIVTFAGVISPGLYQLNVVVPDSAANGDNLVTCSYNGQGTPTGDLIAVLR